MKTGPLFTCVFLAVAAGATAGGSETAIDVANRGAHSFSLANYSEAEALYRRALATWPATTDAARGKGILLGNLGELLRITGRYQEADLCLQDALRQLATAGPSSAADTGRVLDDLAVLRRAQGDLESAEDFAVRAAPLVDDSEKPANRLALASVYIAQNRFAKAQPLLLEIAVVDDARVSLTANLSLSVAALGTGSFPQAEVYARRAFELAQRALPHNHPAIATALNDLAAACRFQGQYLEAEKRYREAIEIWEATLGPEHPDLAEGLLGLAGLYHERERETGAETLYARAIGILEHSLGKNDPRAWSARIELADVLRAERRFTESEKLLRGTLAIMEKSFGPLDPRVQHALSYQARLLNQTNRKAEAAAILKRIAPDSAKAQPLQ